MTVVAAPARPDSTPPVPRQLPPGPRSFVNRVRELDALDAIAAEPGPGIAVLSGMSGVGKTAVALRWARTNADRFPGGQLYVDLALHRRRGGVSTSDVLAAFLTAIGMHEHLLPTGPADRAALFRSRTAGRPVLVIVENADQPAQVRPLVPGCEGSLVIVTSQSRLTGLAFDDAEFVRVEPLDEENAFAMLAPAASRSGDHGLADVRGLIGLCGGLPVALRVVSARLAERNRWSPAALTAHLAVDDQRLDRLSVGDHRLTRVLDSVTAALSEQARRAYWCLALHPGAEFGAGVAAAAARLPGEDGHRALDELFEANLVDGAGPQRYRVHDIVRLHARRLASEQAEAERMAAADAVDRWYLAWAIAADLAVAGRNRWRLGWPSQIPAVGPLAPAEAMRWYEAERANLAAVVRSAADRARHEFVLRFCEALWPFYHARKYHADWIETHRLGIESAVHECERIAEVRMRNQLARAYIELDQVGEAEAELDLAWAAAEPADEPRARAVVLESRGVLNVRTRHYAAAAECFARSLDINESVGDERGTALQHYHRADAMVRGGIDVPEAIAQLETALRISTAIGDEVTTARAQIVLGAARIRTGSAISAREPLEQAVETLRKRRQPAKEIQALRSLAEVAAQLSDRRLAAACDARLATLRAETGYPA